MKARTIHNVKAVRLIPGLQKCIVGHGKEVEVAPCGTLTVYESPSTFYQFQGDKAEDYVFFKFSQSFKCRVTIMELVEPMEFGSSYGQSNMNIICGPEDMDLSRG